jgi:type I restriction enzyme M protein
MKNCEISDEDRNLIVKALIDFKETDCSKIFPIGSFGYWQVTIERPLRIAGIDPNRAYSPQEITTLQKEVKRDQTAPPVIRKIHRGGRIQPDPLHGLFQTDIDGEPCVVEYVPDPDLRDREQVPLLESGGVASYITREVLPHIRDVWVSEQSTKMGYEISFTQHFYKLKPLRSLEEIGADILALEKRSEGMIDDILRKTG